MNLLNPHELGRHGEVILKKVDVLPKGAKLVESGTEIVIGKSESHHDHVLTVPRGTGVVKMYEIDGKTYLDIPRKADLIHQKESQSHSTQTFAPGIYIREIRQSYSYASQQMQRTLD